MDKGGWNLIGRTFLLENQVRQLTEEVSELKKKLGENEQQERITAHVRRQFDTHLNKICDAGFFKDQGKKSFKFRITFELDRDEWLKDLEKPTLETQPYKKDDE